MSLIRFLGEKIYIKKTMTNKTQFCELEDIKVTRTKTCLTKK